MVYHGPSGGCRTCRTRRVKCDRKRPACSNCIRREHACPGYDDVFDGAHRSQNQVVRRQVQRQVATTGGHYADSGQTDLGGGNSLELASATSTNLTATNTSKVASRWIMYSATVDRPWSTLMPMASRESRSSVVVTRDSQSLIPRGLQQNIEDTSICFFFRYYGTTAFDPEAHSGFNQLWRPMYSQAPAQSSMRLATIAVTVTIAMMWDFRGCNTLPDERPARDIFTKAVAAARSALQDPDQSLTDEILMTILIFDLYDALMLHYAPGPLDYGKHKQGTIAMIQHRGSANHTTSRGRALIRAARHSLLPYMLSSRKPIPERLDHLFDHPSVNNTKASALDLISIKLSRVQARLWALRLESRLKLHSPWRMVCYQEIISDSLRIESLLIEWQAGITDPQWLPEYISHDSVMGSIRQAGFYGLRCSVWVDLAFGGLWVLFSIRYLLTLQLIRQSFTDEPSLTENSGYTELMLRADQKIQELVDFVCETIPFYLGDNVTAQNPMYPISINFPYKIKHDPTSGDVSHIPSLASNHHDRAAASAGWILFPQLVDVWRLAEPEDDAVSIVLRDGQLDWIKGQVRRLQKIFLFCDPVWFKRPMRSSSMGY